MTGTSQQPPKTKSLEVGDFVPKIVLPDTTGESIDLTYQLIAGNTLALWFFDEKPGKAEWEKIDQLRDATADAEVLHFIVIGGKKSPKKSGKSSAKATELFDAENKLRMLFACAGGSVALIDPNHRLSKIGSISELDDLIAACNAIAAQTAPEPASYQAPVLVMKDVLEPELCADLLAYWEAGEKKADGVSQGDIGSNIAKANIKKRNDVVLLDEGLFNRVKTRLVKRLMPELMKVFHFKTASMEALRIGCYDSANQGHFGRHRDNRTAFTAHRRFAVSLNLNPIDYEGGQVRFPEYGRAVYAPPPGGAVVFSCSLLHEALPVTKGRRFAIFTFLTDEAGALAEQKMMAERKKQITPLAMK
ncbi:2OG-Fe(II) oxygenase [Thalassospira sp. A40-3]|uniref:2OG-Fe(II) oxygenase family protein n=1 Tax=unclassified Thalassospira TaxID=2648997 RepID=UPI0018CF9968|nr:2OG-Fe(II) oxygenase [Thalassospira sp. A40-3]QPO12063.1 2OG-Fe(II) oxygenase [Thalassospira sp. A40-3]